jgi:nucleotide-binding universal stress UspA family protein
MKRFPPKTILVPTDLSEASHAALSLARRFMEKLGSEVTVLHAERFEAPPYFTKSQLDSLEEQRRSILTEAAEFVGKEGEKILGERPETLVVGAEPTKAIRKTCADRDPDLVIMGTHGRSGVKRFWMGSVTERIIRESRRPVLAVRAGSVQKIDTILCAVSSEDAEGAVLEYAVSLAEAFGSPLSIVHATEKGELPKSCPGVTDEVKKRCRLEETLVEGNAAENILRVARDVKPDLVVMGARRWVSILGEFFSTTTEKVMRAVETSLLVVPIKDVEEKDNDC